MSLETLFPTTLYRRSLASEVSKKMLGELLRETTQIRQADAEGQRWSKQNFPFGYTSYGSLSELFRMSNTFAQLKKVIDKHVEKFGAQLDMDLKNHPLEMTHMWVNVVGRGGHHSGHIHPLSSVSGTFYLAIEEGGLKFEDPRLNSFMGTVPRLAKARRENQRFVMLKTKPLDLLLFESWLRHEVPQSQHSRDRISVSFNYNWF